MNWHKIRHDRAKEFKGSCRSSPTNQSMLFYCISIHWYCNQERNWGFPRPDSLTMTRGVQVRQSKARVHTFFFFFFGYFSSQIERVRLLSNRINRHFSASFHSPSQIYQLFFCCFFLINYDQRQNITGNSRS